MGRATRKQENVTLLVPTQHPVCDVLAWNLESTSSLTDGEVEVGCSLLHCYCEQQQNGFKGTCPLYSSGWAVHGQRVSFIRHPRMTGLAPAARTVWARGIIGELC